VLVTVVRSGSLMLFMYTPQVASLQYAMQRIDVYRHADCICTTRSLQLRSEKEALLFNRGELEERLHELTVTVDKQRTTLSEQHSAQRTAAARLEAVTAERGVLLSELHTLRKAAKADKLSRSSSTATDTVRRLKEQCSAAAHKLEQAQSEAAALRHVCSAKEGQLSQLRRELTAARAENTSQFALKDALKEARREATALRKQLEREKAERTQWAQARTQLLSQFYSEEARLESVLGACDLDATAASSSGAAVQ
jgi:chromosome segregation ATPase